MTFSRALPAAALVALLGTALTACGSPDKSADTQACRSYMLSGGAVALTLLSDLDTAVKNGSWEPEPLTAEIRKVSDSAAAAGRTTDLRPSTYRLFENLVTATATVQADITPAADNRVLDTGTVATLRKAVSGVHMHCDPPPS